jgi:hypothetical protein
LQYDLHVVEEALIKNQEVPATAEDGFFKRTFKSIGNEVKLYKSFNLTKTKDAIEKERDEFLVKQQGKNIKLYGESEISYVMDEVFSEDKFYLEEAMFSISVIFDNEYHYEYDEDGLSYISNLLWNNSDKLATVKKSVEGYYRELARQPLTGDQKFVLGSVAALTLLTMTMPALAIAGLSASGITASLAGLGGTMVEGVGFIVLAELLLDGAIIGFTYSLLDGYNKKKVKESFREMNYNDAAQLLAIKCYIMQIAKAHMPKSLFKEKTSELLEMISDLKSDTDYVLLVEGQNVDENKKKIHVFHNLDHRLGKMFCM